MGRRLSYQNRYSCRANKKEHKETAMLLTLCSKTLKVDMRTLLDDLFVTIIT